MRYVLDTVALVRHFSAKGKLGRQARFILDNIEESGDVFIISTISLMELMYLSEKQRINLNFQDTLIRIEQSASYSIVDLNVEVLKVAASVDFYELHDRLILATAKWLDIPIISSDRSFPGVEGIVVIWE